MTIRQRSKNPDLLLPEVMEERVKRITDFWGWRIGTLQDLDRITAFITHRCNLGCEYCNGPHLTLKQGNTAQKKQMLQNDLTITQFEHLLQQAQTNFIKHIHFTGGEATLNPDLPKLIEIATAFGILSSLTTNGIANSDLYRELIDKGLTEIRISIDSYSEEIFDSIVNVRGSFQKVVQNIRLITALRDQFEKDIFLVINACIGEANLEEIEHTLQFLISLNPNDIKFLVIAQDKRFVLGKRDEMLIARLKQALAKYPKDQFVLLREKIKRLFDPFATGLEDQKTQKIMTHCFIPMTERTIDSMHYYPCSIYLRYFGKPIGELTDTFEVQQEKIMDFVRNHDCCQDPICLKNCTNCCRVFNTQTNQALTLDTGQILYISDDITERQVIDMMTEIRTLIVHGTASDKTFIIIKPLGLKYKDQIIAFLKDNGLEIESMDVVNKWEDCATFFYTWPLTEENIRSHLQMKKGFDQIEKGQAIVIRFKSNPSPNYLLELKLEIRRLFPGKRHQLEIAGKTRWIRMNTVHSPNPSDVQRENAILNGFINK